MTTRIVVEIPNISNQIKHIYPPRTIEQNLKSIEKARICNLYESGKTQCREFRNQPQAGVRRS